MPYQPAILGSARLNNFRLAYLTADQAGDRPYHLRVILGGVDITQPGAPTRFLHQSMTIRDLLFDAPNTCALTLYGAAPSVGMRLEVWINSDTPVLLFAGELQTVDRTFKGQPSTVIHPCTAIDDTARANRKRPLGAFVDTSASTIAAWLISTYAPGYSSAGVEPGLPAISITFDGSEAGMKGCLTAVAKLVGGYWYFENRVLYLFVTPPGPAPDPIDDTPNRFLHEPAVTWTIDKSQVRTRVYGKGASSRLLSAVAAGTDLLPVQDGVLFNPAGGKAIAGSTPDGAAWAVLAYTGVTLGGGGSLVGPGAGPAAALSLSLADGTGIPSGAHEYAVTFLTAAGESLPSPRAAIVVGVTTPPGLAPVPGQPTAGGAIDAGAHSYAVTFVTAAGETTSSPGSGAVTTTVGSGVSVPTAHPFNDLLNLAGNLQVGAAYRYQMTFITASGESLPSGTNVPVQVLAGWQQNRLWNIVTSNDARVTGRKLYRSINTGSGHGPSLYLATLHNNVETSYIDNIASVSGNPSVPTVDTTGGASYRTVHLTGIAIGGVNVTGRKVYRSSGGAAYKLVDTIPNNTATTYTDTKATAALGANLPTANTAPANQVRVGLQLGPSGVTGRRIYRTNANTSQLLLVGEFLDNTSTTWNDNRPDNFTAVVVPVVDTSGLQQPGGQVPAGATSMLVATAAAFAAAGGWAVVGNGEQTIRYAGTTPTSLTGIPASGPGALVAPVSYNSTVTPAPALVGVAGAPTMNRGAPVAVWVQRDDLEAQAYLVALDGGGDGIYEHIVRDERRSEPSLVQMCDAELALYSRPLVTVTYATRDLKTKSGKTVAIALASPAINESLTIQDVTISEIGTARRTWPRFQVTASSVHHTFEAILRMLIRKAE